MLSSIPKGIFKFVNHTHPGIIQFRKMSVVKKWELLKYSRVVRNEPGFKDDTFSNIPLPDVPAASTSQGTSNPSAAMQDMASQAGTSATQGPSSTGSQKAAGKKNIDVTGTSHKLTLTVTESCHLLLTHDDDVIENYSLWGSRKWLKAFAKGDCMMIVIKTKNEHHRICIKFSPNEVEGATGLQQCDNAATELSKYCVMCKIKIPGQDPTNESSIADHVTSSIDTMLPVAKIAEILTSEPLIRLPAAYQNTNIPTDQLELLVSLCLTDANFPAFVGKVEQTLHKMTAKS